MTKFTAQTKFTPMGAKRPALLIYTDMRGHTWHIVQNGDGEDAEWRTWPSTEAAAAYGLAEFRVNGPGYPGNYFAMSFGPNAAQSIINGIEERLEAARAASATPGEHFDRTPDKKFPWWLVIVGAILLKKKGRR